MTAKEYLEQARRLDARISAKFEQIERWRALLARRTAVYGDSPRSGGSAGDRPADVVARVLDAERELDAQIDRLVDLRREIAATIARVGDERMRTLLELRYLSGATWREIADKLGYTESNVYNLHRAALKLCSQLQFET